MRLPPPAAGEPRERLLEAFGRVRFFVQSLVRSYADELACGQGCDGCCRQVLTLRGVEASYLLEGARGLLPEAVSLVWSRLSRPGPAECCPLLHGGVCLGYEHRPALCRTHGLPMLRKEGRRSVLHHCPKNFRGTDVNRLPPSLVLDEERLCVVMDAVDAIYCRQTGWDGRRVSMDELLRAGLHP